MDDIYGIIPVSKFKECKTRLSPFLSEEERENLLKVMLKDVTDTLRKYTDKIIIISADEDVLNYAKSLNLSVLKENDNSNLNKALKQAMEYCKGKTKKVIIMPSDIPLIGKTNLKMVIDSRNKEDRNVRITVTATNLEEVDVAEFYYYERKNRIHNLKISNIRKYRKITLITLNRRL